MVVLAFWPTLECTGICVRSTIAMITPDHDNCDLGCCLTLECAPVWLNTFSRVPNEAVVLSTMLAICDQIFDLIAGMSYRPVLFSEGSRDSEFCSAN